MKKKGINVLGKMILIMRMLMIAGAQDAKADEVGERNQQLDEQ